MGSVLGNENPPTGALTDRPEYTLEAHGEVGEGEWRLQNVIALARDRRRRQGPLTLYGQDLLGLQNPVVHRRKCF
jgi:hypothetical protein